MRYKRCPTKRTSFLIMIHPTVQTTLMKYMSAIDKLPDLITGFKFIQTNPDIEWKCVTCSFRVGSDENSGSRKSLRPTNRKMEEISLRMRPRRVRRCRKSLGRYRSV
uniref:Uncharacterized protein n=1 Tax=Helianthus annuus TaxID=4232 RepID=A0A251SPL3_HELAN